MSAKKVIRLKTPVKGKEEGRGSEATTQLSGEDFNQESTIMLVKNVACSEELQVTLINEINKIYKEMSKLKQAADDSTLKREQACKENRTLKGRLEILEREYKMYKEMYELERDNHDCLRKFYENREKEWLAISAEHKRILHDYESRTANGLSDIRLLPEYLHLESMYTHVEELLAKPTLPNTTSKDTRLARGGRRLRNSLEREDSLSQPKLRLKLSSQKEVNKYKDTSQLRQEQDKSSIQVKGELDTSRKAVARKSSPQSEQLFNSTIRKTFYRYRAKEIAVYEIEQLQDMVKLKNAKTSTRDRLAKTIRKLDFQLNNDQDLRVFCETVERLVLEKHRVLRGDYAFDLLIEKLRECEGYALLCGSGIYQGQGESSVVLGEDIYRQKTLELPVDSTIKDDKTLQKIRKMSSEQDFERIEKVKASPTALRRND